MRKTTGIFNCVFGVGRPVRLASQFHPAYLIGFLLLLIPNTSLAQSSVNSGASWSQYKSQCGIPASMAYNDWDGSCPNGKAGGNGSTPSVPPLNPQQQLGMQLGMMGAGMVGQAIGQGLHDWLFGSPGTPPVAAPLDPAEEQRQLAALQLNNSGLYLLRQKNYAGAIDEFQKALAIIPNDSNTLNNLALAKQKLKDAAVAGQTSSALGQLLGNAPANTGLFGFDHPPDSWLTSPNSSALSLVNLDSDANVVDLHGTTKTLVDQALFKNDSAQPLTQAADNQETLQSLDNLLADHVDPALKRQLNDFASSGLRQSSASDSARSAIGSQPEIPNQRMDAEQTSNAIDQAIGQNQGPNTSLPSVQSSTGKTPATVFANGATQQPNLQAEGSIGNPDFDGNKTGNAPIVIGHPNSVQSGVDLRGAGTTTVNPARVNGSSALNSGSGTATEPVSTMNPAGLDGFSASGAPIVDCAGDAATINRLVAGLAAQQEAISRSQAAFDAAREDAQHDSAEAREKWTEGTIKMLASTASSIASSSQKLLAAEEGVKATGIPANVAARYKFLEKIKKIHELSDKLEGAGKSYLAGNAFGNTLLIQKTAQDLTDLIREAGILLVDSGIAEEAGGKFALALWGPIGEIGFQGVTTGLDLLTATSTGFISTAEANRAALNLEVMRSEYQRAQNRIYELQQELVQGCSKRSN